VYLTCRLNLVRFGRSDGVLLYNLCSRCDTAGCDMPNMKAISLTVRPCMLYNAITSSCFAVGIFAIILIVPYYQVSNYT